MRILILGGTAFIGIHMIEAARERGHTVTLFNRGQTHSELFPDVDKLKGDRDGQLEALRGRSWDAVIDNSGYVPRHVRLSAELLAPNVGHYLFISTISVYADFSRVNDETSPVAKVEDEAQEDWKKAYGALKALCEKAADAAMPGRTTMIRPGLIVGPHDNTDRLTYWVARAAQGGEMLAPGDPKASYQIIDARDLAAFCLDALENSTFGVCNVISPAGLFTRGDIVTESIAAAHTLAKPDSPLRPTWVPTEFLVEQKVQSYFDRLFCFPEDGELRGLQHTRVEQAIEAGLKISPLQKTMRDTLAWHLTRPAAERAHLQGSIALEREREVLALWHARSQPPTV